VLGPRPPPWRKVEFYWIFMIFNDFRAFNRAGKTVTKIGIYSKPPLKIDFYSIFIKIYVVNCSGNSLRPITELSATIFWSLVLYCSLPFFGILAYCYSEFFWLWFCFGCRIVVLLGLSCPETNP
jgi:hypothetical protein